MLQRYISIKIRDLSNEPQAKHFKIGIYYYLKTLSKCQKQKDQKNIGFWAKNGELVKALSKPAQLVKVPVEVWSRGAKNTLSLPVDFLSRSRVKVTCQALNVPTSSEPISPQLDRLMLLFGFLDPKVRNLQIESSTLFMKKRTPAFICLPTCSCLKSSFFSWCIKSLFAYSLVHIYDSSQP